MEQEFDSMDNMQMQEEPLKPKKPKKSKAKKRVLTAVISIVAILLIILIAVLLIVNAYLDKINYEDSMSGTGEYIDEIDPTQADSPQQEIDDALNNVRDNANAEYELMYDDDVMNVLFIGSDARYTGQGSRSDSMILVSINKRTEKIVATSLLRDTFVSIPGNGENRINAAYAFGGTDLLFETIEQNLKLKVDKFVLVDFETFVSVIDSIGGVELDITNAEANYLNGGLDSSVETYNGYDGETKRLPGAGTYRLNGEQALTYARIRKIDSDRQRSQRQRNVLEAIFDEVKEMNYTELNNFANTVLPLVNTNVSKSEIVMLMLRMPEIIKYDTEQYTMPADGTYKYVTIGHRAVTTIDFEENIAMLRKNIYGWE